MEGRIPQDRSLVTVNGETRSVQAGNIGELLEELGFGSPRGGIAVALNGRVVARGRWNEQRVATGDRVEVVGAVQGG